MLVTIYSAEKTVRLIFLGYSNEFYYQNHSGLPNVTNLNLRVIFALENHPLPLFQLIELFSYK